MDFCTLLQKKRKFSGLEIVKLNFNLENAINIFVQKHQENYYDYFQKCQSPFLINAYIEHKDYNLAKSVKYRVIMQNIMRKRFSVELEKLYEYAKINNIELIGLKGIFLETDVFIQTGNIRLYNDIDLLVRNKDTRILSEYFIKDGNYVIYDDKHNIIKKLLNKESVKYIKKINIDKTNHIVLQKKLNDGNIIIELHSNFNILKLSNFDHLELHNNKKLISYSQNVSFYTLNELDHLLYLCHHMVRHLPYVYTDCLGPLFINIDKIIDIAMLLNKYNFDSQLLYDKCVRYSILPYVTLSFYITNEIFPGCIDESIIDKFIQLSKNENFSWKKIFLKLISLSPIEILTGNIERTLPKLKHTINFIEKHIGPFEECTKFRNLKILYWKIMLFLEK